MKALSLTQPWAWLVVHGGKDVENRTWNTKFRGRFLVHAAKAMKPSDYETAQQLARRTLGYQFAHDMPLPEQLERGGIIGSVELVTVVHPLTEQQQELGERQHAWHFPDQFGFVLKGPIPLPFQECRGALGFWDASHLQIGDAS